jgi:2-keto-4-pentenoate hydratase/2-oxohepta-3-ene-1,7-dioic acid hydratase in catechol pathway
VPAAVELTKAAPASGALVRMVRDGEPVWAVDEAGELFSLDRRPLGRVEDARLLPPVAPGKILGLGYNYRDLMEEQRQASPLVFLKAPNALAADGDEIRIVAGEHAWIEIELGIVLARGGRGISVRDAQACIFGYVVANDITAAEPAGRDHHLAVSKSRDGFCPVSSRLWRGVDVSDRAVESRINGRLTQRSRTSNRFLTDAEAVSLASRHMTLEPGDLILTGTPAGAREARVRPGDAVEVSIEGLGVVRNRFVEDRA